MIPQDFEKTIQFIRDFYELSDSDFIPLHTPIFSGNEKKYVLSTIDSTFVSSVGQFVDDFEAKICKITGAKKCIAIVNGTSALHLALLSAGVKNGEEVITQPLTFVATANTIAYCGAIPSFVDVCKDTLGMSAEALQDYLTKISIIKDNQCYNKLTGRKISACVPMHTYGHPCKIDDIVRICDNFGIVVVEDSAESLGSYYKEQHTGTFGKLGVFSLNGNKTFTSGGGGCIITNDVSLGKHIKHISTTAKKPHPWEYYHDEIGYNLRLPNLNAALACAQLEQFDKFIFTKRILAKKYENFFKNTTIKFIAEPPHSKSNYWLNTILFKDKETRDKFLEYSNGNNVMTRPVWKLMNELPMFKDCHCESLPNAKFLEDRIVCLPSSVNLSVLEA